MKFQGIIYFLFLNLIINSGCLSFENKIVNKEKKELDSRIIVGESKYFYEIQSVDATSEDKIIIQIRGIKETLKVKETKFSAHQVEEKNVKGISETWKNDNGYCCIAGAILSPVLLPFDLIESIDKDLGVKEIIQNDSLPSEKLEFNPDGVLKFTDNKESGEVLIENGIGIIIKRNVVIDKVLGEFIFFDKRNKIEQSLSSKDLFNVISAVSYKNILSSNGGYNDIPWGISFNLFKEKFSDEKSSEELNLESYESDHFFSKILMNSNNNEVMSYKVETDIDEVNYIFINNHFVAVEKKLKENRSTVLPILLQKYKNIKKDIMRKSYKVQSIYIPDTYSDDLIFTYASYDTLFELDSKTEIAFVGNQIEDTQKNQENAEKLQQCIKKLGLAALYGVAEISSDMEHIDDASIFYYSKQLIKKQNFKNLKKQEN